MALGLSAGCRTPDQRPQIETTGERGLTQERAALLHTVVGTSLEGRPIDCYGLGHGSEVVLIMASIHGNEPAGTPLVRRLVAYLAERPDLLRGKRVLLMPVANPDGFAHASRHNVNGVDLNRNFPASNYRSASDHGTTALSEPESVAIHRLLEKERPDRIVSIHQPMNHGNACIDYDGPGEALARAMAGQAGLPVTKLGGRPGSLGSFVGMTMAIPIVTVELPKAACDMDDETLWSNYGTMLLTAILFPDSPGNSPQTASK